MKIKHKIFIGLIAIAAIWDLVDPTPKDPNIQEAWVMAVVAVAGLALSAYQAYESSQQAKAAEDLANTPRPVQQMPRHMKQALQSSSYLAKLTKAPGSDMEQAYSEEQAAQLFEEGKDVARTGNQAQGLLEAKYGAMAGDQRLREADNQAFQVAMKGQDIQVKTAAANMEYDLDTTNIMEPYYRRMAASSALRNASEQNKWGAINTGLSAASTYGAHVEGNSGSGEYYSAESRAARKSGRMQNRENRQTARTERQFSNNGFEPVIDGESGYYAGGYGNNPYAPGYYQYGYNS